MYSHTLVLTPWMAPHRWAPWQHVMIELMNGKAEILEEYPEVIYPAALDGSSVIPGWMGQIPAVVRLVKPVSTFKKGVKFSRINVFTRDHFTCQYCGTKKAMKDLNYDHVIPRIRGGKTVWENIVTACYPCNDRKGGRTPEQAGMKLRTKPIVPATLPMTPPMMPNRFIHDVVKPYLGQAVTTVDSFDGTRSEFLVASGG